MHILLTTTKHIFPRTTVVLLFLIVVMRICLKIKTFHVFVDHFLSSGNLCVRTRIGMVRRIKMLVRDICGLTVCALLCVFTGTAKDSLGSHRGQAFSTKDRDNDKSSSRNCASLFKGAWWYNSCHSSNLNGLYLNGKTSAEGMTWYYWKNAHYSVKRSEMKIRPQSF